MLADIVNLLPELTAQRDEYKTLNPYERAKFVWGATTNFVKYKTHNERVILRAAPKPDRETRKTFKLFQENPKPKTSVYWCLLNDEECEIVLHLNWSELEPTLGSEKPTWPQSVLGKVPEFPELQPFFTSEEIPPDVAQVLRWYPHSREDVVTKPDVFTRWLQQTALPKAFQKFPPSTADSKSNWLVSGVKWLTSNVGKVAVWMLRNPLWAALLNLCSKVARLALCLYFAKITPEELEKLFGYVLASVGGSNPLFVVAIAAVSCLGNLALNVFTGNLSALPFTVAECVAGLAAKVANLGGVVKMFTNLLISVLQYVADFVKDIRFVGPVVQGGVQLVQLLLTCSSSPWDCLKSFVSTDAAQKLTVDLVVSKHMGLQLGTFGLLLTLEFFGTAVEAVLKTYIPPLRPIMQWLEDKGLRLFQLVTYATKTLTQGVGSVFRQLFTTLEEIRGWVEFLWGCGLKRFIHAIQKMFGLEDPALPIPSEETQISCCMADLVTELRKAVNTTSFLKEGVAGAAALVKEGVVDAFSTAWNWLPCDQRHKVLLFSAPVATVKYRRKRVHFYAFVWKKEAPYACDQQVHVAPLAQKFKKQFPSAVRHHPQGHGLIINISRCPQVVQRAFRYLHCPVITLDRKCPLELRQLSGGHALID